MRTIITQNEEIMIANHIHCITATENDNAIQACLIRDSGVGGITLGVYSSKERCQFVMEVINTWLTMRLTPKTNYSEYVSLIMPLDDDVLDDVDESEEK